MHKEIFEQPESITNTMRGRVLRDAKEVVLGGIKVGGNIGKMFVNFTPTSEIGIFVGK